MEMASPRQGVGSTREKHRVPVVGSHGFTMGRSGVMRPIQVRNHLQGILPILYRALQLAAGGREGAVFTAHPQSYWQTLQHWVASSSGCLVDSMVLSCLG